MIRYRFQPLTRLCSVITSVAALSLIACTGKLTSNSHKPKAPETVAISETSQTPLPRGAADDVIVDPAYYVSPSGSDTSDGRSQAAAFKTIAKALATAQDKGDVIYVMAGTYLETISVDQDDIVLREFPKNKVVITGSDTLPNGDWGALLSVGGNRNVVSGLELQSCNIKGKYLGGYGIEVSGHHNIIRKMNVHDIWETGVMIEGDYNLVEDSVISMSALQNSTPAAQAREAGWASGMSGARNARPEALIKGITSYAIFRRNQVFNNWGEGLSCFESDHCTIEDNVVYDNWTVNLYLSDSTNSLVQRNIVYLSSAPAIPTRNNGRSGILLADEVAAVPRSANNVIINNFIYNASFGAFSWSGVDHSGLDHVLIAYNTIVDGSFSTGNGGSPSIVNTNSQIRNNIIFGTKSDVPSTVGLTFSNNNWAVAPQAVSSGNVVGDPKIARAGETTAGSLTSEYFKILAGSPVIKAAIALPEVTEDFFGTTRRTDSDLGGHEFH